MELLLVKKKQDIFHLISQDDEQNRQSLNFPEIPLNLDFVGDYTSETYKPGTNDEGPPKTNSLRSEIMKLLCGYVPRGHETSLPKRLYLNVYATLKSSKAGIVSIMSRKNNNVTINDALEEVQIFDRVIESSLLKISTVFNLKLKLYLEGTDQTTFFELCAKDLLIEKIGGVDWRYGISTPVEITDEIWRLWRDVGAVHVGELTLTMSLHSCAIPNLYRFRSSENRFDGWPRKMLDEGIGSDLIIVVDEEKNKEEGIKCHKFVLADRSPVFKAMFETPMLESKENLLKITDMSEGAMRVFLEYIYCWDLSEALTNCEIAFELLYASHKYEISDLEIALTDILCDLPCTWFTVDVAVKLLLFSENVKIEKSLKRSLEILKWFARNTGNLKNSLEYKNMFLKSPRVAMELGEKFLMI